jgi:PleD family two-component response regulator
MSKQRILIVEDDVDIATMLRIYFEAQGYEILVAGRGRDALELSRRQLPHVVVLDIRLPDIDGYEVCRQLRKNLRTSHIPILFLTQKDERSDKIAGLELGADDYITKPFDIEELRLRVQNALRRAAYESLTSPVTGLPSSRLIEDQLKQLLRTANWSVLYIGIKHYQPFTEVYGFVAGDDVLRFMSMVITEVVNELGTPDDFIGHVGDDDFIVITRGGKTQLLAQQISERFAKGISAFYSFQDRERGGLLVEEAGGKKRQEPLMSLAIGVITDRTMRFSDIREITEVASEARRASSA